MSHFCEKQKSDEIMSGIERPKNKTEEKVLKVENVRKMKRQRENEEK